MPDQLSATKILVLPKSKTELAFEYRMSRNTILDWCKRIGIVTDRNRLTPKQVRQFYLHYGPPGEVDEDKY